jgi:hypothetical protein
LKRKKNNLKKSKLLFFTANLFLRVNSGLQFADGQLTNIFAVALRHLKKLQEDADLQNPFLTRQGWLIS